MHHSKHTATLGGILLVVYLLFASTPVASTAFAATTGAHAALKARTLFTASSHLAPDFCPPTCTHPINMCPPSQQEGNSNDWVKVIKFRLNALDSAGLAPTNSVFTSSTKDAVVAFQNKKGITDGGGAVGDRTWSAMGFCLGFSNITLGDSGFGTLTSCPPSQSEGGSNTLIFVKAIQDLLNTDFNAGIFPNTPENFHPYLASDGKFGPDTKAAVIDFQDKIGISGGGGEVGQRTWSELGMCP